MLKESTVGNEEVDMRRARGLHVKFFNEEDVDQPCRKESVEVGNSFIPEGHKEDDIENLEE